MSSNNTLPSEVQLLSAAWPEQIVGDLEPLWIEWRSLSGICPATAENQITFRKRFCAFFNHSDLNPRRLAEWVAGLYKIVNVRDGKLIGPTTIARHVIMAKGFLRWLKASGYIQYDPSLGIRTPREAPPGVPKCWTHEEYTKMIEWCRYRPSLQTHLWLIMLSYNTGMSLKDCCYLRWEEVVMDEDGPCYVHKNRAKTRHLGRRCVFTVPIVPGSECYARLLKLYRTRHLNYKRFDGIVYVHQDAPGLYENTMRLIHLDFKNIFNDAKVRRDNLSFRHLRNSFCSRLINSGADSILVSKMTGHANLKQLDAYVKPDIRAMSDAMLAAQRYAEGEGGVIKTPKLLKQG